MLTQETAGLAALEALLEPLLDVFVDKLARRLERGQARMVSQSRSELGPRRHREAVRRRMDHDEGGAYITPDGRKYLLTLEAYHEELARGSAPRKVRKAEPRRADAPTNTPAAAAADFERELMAGLRRVRGTHR